MKYEWQDLPKPMNCFTVRRATMINLNSGKIVQHYSANTKIVVVQKCITPEKTYYRTRDAEHNYLNYAFEASAFGLPNEKASLEHSSVSSEDVVKPKVSAQPLGEKQKQRQKEVSPKSEEVSSRPRWWKQIFGRHNV